MNASSQGKALLIHRIGIIGPRKPTSTFIQLPPRALVGECVVHNMKEHLNWPNIFDGPLTLEPCTEILSGPLADFLEDEVSLRICHVCGTSMMVAPHTNLRNHVHFWRRHLTHTPKLRKSRGCRSYRWSFDVAVRYFNVRIGHSSSHKFIQDQGVPQGSVLSVTLFIIHMSNILHQLPPSVRGMLYVDDLQVSCQGSDMRLIERQLQTTVNRLVQWCDQNGHTISPSKSSCVHIFSFSLGVYCLW
ncbi:putative RNA-directed DNA polymerase from transposon BS [Trichonephila clavipes]|nr:putative RNA-directed DNA polymerase from transposon BS [Trichonephila clavipes]